MRNNGESGVTILHGEAEDGVGNDSLLPIMRTATFSKALRSLSFSTSSSPERSDTSCVPRANHARDTGGAFLMRSKETFV